SRGAARARTGAALAPAVYARALRGLGQRADGRLVREPPALLRRAFPAVVSARRERRGHLRAADSRARGPAAGRSLDGRARGLPAFTALRAQWVHGLPRRDLHVGDGIAYAADRRALSRSQ